MERTDDKPAKNDGGQSAASPVVAQAHVSKLVGLAVLFGGLAAALVFTPPVRLVAESGMTTTFPEQVGVWDGETLYFCQAKGCGAPCLESERLPDALDRCPTCAEGTLDTGAYAERVQLPADTYIHKKRYLDAENRMVQAAIVLSGARR